VRIPLDYYRILGLTVQASVEQLAQNHHDRVRQLPRREYSEAAIAARKALLDQAFETLSDPTKRQNYDKAFFAKLPETQIKLGDRTGQASGDQATSKPEPAQVPGNKPASPEIEIQDEHFPGALLLLLELGEYELLLRLGQANLSSAVMRLRNRYGGESPPGTADVILSVALACLELGREQWQQGQYENAAESLEVGRELLLREKLFMTVRNEIKADLYRLRPYRILELLALPEENLAQRRKGLQLLKAMLDERGGIDGNGNDQSGLNIDDFLRFIQQLRSYLTVAEQQSLFEEEARRPSAVAIYLAVYALLARGFAQRQPALIRRAKSMLMRLGKHQDVYLEQAVCALLLGQTEESGRVLEMSQDEESLAFIRENSRNAPDLLPGLCLYSERWLQDEVFPYFRDLSNQHVALKDYFAEEQVQAYLEELPIEGDLAPVEMSRPLHNAGSVDSSQVRAMASGEFSREWYASPRRSLTPAQTQQATALYGANGYSRGFGSAPTAIPGNPRRTAALTVQPAAIGEDIPYADRHAPNGISGRTNPAAVHYQNGSGYAPGLPPQKALPASSARGRTRRRRGQRRQSLNLGRLLIVGLLALVTLGGVLVVTGRTLAWIVRVIRGTPSPATSQPLIQSPTVILPSPLPIVEVSPTEVPGALDQDSAKAIIQAWLDAKASAMGPEHSDEKLRQVLVGSALTQWQQQSSDAKSGGWYAQYDHEVVKVELEEPSASKNPDQATIQAEVRETAQFYRDGTPDPESSYDSNVLVKYGLIRQEGQWRIQTITVLN